MSNKIYPSNLIKYKGVIRRKEDGKYLVKMLAKPHIWTKTFETYEDAYKALVDYNISHNLVKNIIYD